MKNLYLIPTDKPSRLHYFTANKAGYYLYPNNKLVIPINPNCINQHIYITSDSDIKEGDWIYSPFQNAEMVLKYNKFVIPFPKDKKIILTTNGDLIKDGVQEIDDDFLEWFVKNPSCESVEVVDDLKYFNIDELRERHIKVLPHLYSEKIGYKIIILKEEPKQETHICKWCKAETWQSDDECYAKQETLEEAAERYTEEHKWEEQDPWFDFMEGAKWQQERMYSAEDMKRYASYMLRHTKYITPKQWFEQFKKK